MNPISIVPPFGCKTCYVEEQLGPANGITEAIYRLLSPFHLNSFQVVGISQHDRQLVMLALC